MPTLFDMLANAQNGKGIDLLARQFNLTQQQTELALEALLPAFSQGLKRNTSDPYGVAGFMSALASGQHGQYFDNAQRAFSIGGGSREARDDLHAFAALARESLGDRVPMEVGEALRRAETAQGSDDAGILAGLASVFGTRTEGLAPVVAETRNPYKGLRPFLEADALDFFGREAFIGRLLERLTNADRSSRFIAVVGPSGSGKSSVVRAGATDGSVLVVDPPATASELPETASVAAAPPARGAVAAAARNRKRIG